MINICEHNKKENGEENVHVLVTGHKGFMGTIVVPMLQAEVTEPDSDVFDRCIIDDQSVDGGIPAIPYLRRCIRDAELRNLRGEWNG
jgi:nucleoside-diphosphate-sugar epimerase